MNTKAVGIKIFASLLLLAAFLQPGTALFLDPSCGLRSGPVYSQSKIINGTDAGVTSSPWMVFILTTDDYFICGGTLITHRLVLTAAHCYHRHRNLKARMGEFNRDWNDGKCLDTVDGGTYCNNRKEIRVDNGVMHPRFNSKSLANDIAILRLAEYVEYTANIKPICIVTDKRWRNYIDQIPILTITGWGRTEAHGTTSRILQTLEIRRQLPEVCTRWVPKTPSDNEFCMGNVESGACNGDFGGPAGKLIPYGNKSRFIQIGIASLSNRKCIYASIYTDVLSHVDWILSVERQIGHDYTESLLG